MTPIAAAPSATATRLVPTAAPASVAPTTSAASAVPTVAPTRAAAAASPTHASEAEQVRVGQTPATRVAPAPDGSLFALAGGALYKIGAGGGAAERRAAASVPPNVLALDGERLVGGAMIACMRGGGGAPLVVSEDGGKRWRQATQAGKALEATPWLARPGEVYALSCGGVHRSRDGGRTYEEVPTLHEANYDPKELAISPDGALAYAAGVSEGGTVRVTRSERRGDAWGPATQIDMLWATAAIAVGADGRVWLGTANDLKVSSDRGATWKSVRQGLEAELLAGDPTKGQLSAEDQKKLNEGYGVADLAVVGAAVYAGTAHGVYVGPSWKKVPGVNGKVTKLQVAGQTVYATTSAGVVRITD